MVDSPGCLEVTRRSNKYYWARWRWWLEFVFYLDITLIHYYWLNLVQPWIIKNRDWQTHLCSRTSPHLTTIQCNHEFTTNPYRNFRGLPTHGFAHAKVKNLIFNLKILDFVGNIGIIRNDFSCWFHSTIKMQVKFIWV